jgi:pectinacetylesterase
MNRRIRSVPLDLTPAVWALALLFVLSVPVAAQPRIGDALDCAKRGEAGGLRAGRSLFRIDVDPAAYPLAICNDGTPAVFYVRAHTNAEGRHRWYIELQGGGGCQDGSSCARRWCSAGTNFGADKMSSRYAPRAGMAGAGSLAADPRNPVAEWNQVFVYYCTSDTWMGRAGDVTLASEAPGGGTVSYRMPFRGADVLDAVIDLLRRGRGPVSYADAAGARQTLPDLDAAQRVLLAGSSAGSSGVVYNADRMGELLRAHNSRCRGEACPLDFRALIDSGFKPALEEMGFAGTSLCRDAGLCSYEAFQRQEWVDVMAGLRRAGGAEASCLTWHSAQAPGTEWRCSDSEHVVENHLTTPFFIRQDLQDRLHVEGMMERGFTVDGQPLDPLAYGRFLEARLRGLAASVAAGEEAAAGGEAPPPPAVLGAQCTEHETLRSGAAFFAQEAPAADGDLYSTAELLAVWLADELPREAIVPFRRPGRLASCNRRTGGR